MNLNELEEELQKYFSGGKSTLSKNGFEAYRDEFEKLIKKTRMDFLPPNVARLLKTEDVQKFNKYFHVETPESNIIKQTLSELRDKDTENKRFYNLMKDLGNYFIPFISNLLPTEEKTIITPVPTENGHAETSGIYLTNDIYVISIPRAADPMADEIYGRIGSEKGYANISRNEKTLKPEMGSVKINSIEGKSIVAVDPMIATGGVMSDLLEKLRDYGNPKRVIVVGVVATPFGLWNVVQKARKFGEYHIIIAAIDGNYVENGSIAFGMNSKGYIVPGLGDAGDRAFGKHL